MYYDIHFVFFVRLKWKGFYVTHMIVVDNYVYVYIFAQTWKEAFQNNFNVKLVSGYFLRLISVYCFYFCIFP